MTVGKVRNPWLVILFSVITLGIYALYWFYVSFKEIKDFNNAGVGGAVGLIIAIVFGIIDWFLLPAGIKTMYETQNQEVNVSVLTGFWFLLPIVGGIIWTIKVQNAMNRMWEANA